MMTQVREVVVVGAGLLGLAAAHALVARGRDVVVLEQADGIGHARSGSKGSCRIFRLGYPDADYVAAARLARELWRDLEAESGRRILWPCPQLTIGAGLSAVQAAMRAAGAPCDLLTAAEAASRYPAVRTGGPALVEPESAVTAADQALAALATGLPEIRTGVTALRLADDGRQVTVSTSAGPVTARTAVITAGPWSGRLLASAGVAVPGRTTLEQVAYLRPGADGGAADGGARPAAADSGAAGAGAGSAGAAAAPPAEVVPIILSHSPQSPYGLPVPGSTLYKIGIHPSGPAIDPDGQEQNPDDGLTARLAEVARRYLPGYEPDAAAIERCCYDNSPDEDFILDRSGNVIVGCGTSGHGFKFGPLLGSWLADLALGTPAATSAEAVLRQRLWERFALSRFSPAAASPMPPRRA